MEIKVSIDTVNVIETIDVLLYIDREGEKRERTERV
jgi:hypothetical protein